MAERRMFNKQITRSDAFLDMPRSTRLLYYDLSLDADDDGFIDKYKSIMRLTEHIQPAVIGSLIDLHNIA